MQNTRRYTEKGRIPLASPAAPYEADKVEHPCLNCRKDIKPVPGGTGTVWVHVGTGFTFCEHEDVVK